MRTLRRSTFWCGLPVALAGFSLAAADVSSAQADNPFDNLLGTWAGSGELALESGQRERIKCNAYYTGGGKKLRVAVRCASSSYKVEIRSKLARVRDTVSGTWEERTYNASGDVVGRTLENGLSFSIRDGGFSGSMSVSYGDSKQTVSLSTRGINLKSVKMVLSRAKE